MTNSHLTTLQLVAMRRIYRSEYQEHRVVVTRLWRKYAHPSTSPLGNTIYGEHPSCKTPNQVPPAVRRTLNGARQIVETVNSQLAEQFRIEVNHAQSFGGLCARLYTKLTAHTLCLYLNRVLGNAHPLHIKALAFPPAELAHWPSWLVDSPTGCHTLAPTTSRLKGPTWITQQPLKYHRLTDLSRTEIALSSTS